MLIRIFNFGLVFFAISSFGASPSSYLYLFESAKDRATASLAKQISRRKLALEEFKRTAYLVKTGAVTLDEYEQIGTAVKLAELDYRIAEIKVKQVTLSLNLANALARNGRPIPLCKRRVQKDENTVSKYLVKPKPYKLPENKDFGRGTRIEVEKLEPPPAPPPNLPVEPQEPPPNPNPFPAPIKPPETDPDPLPAPGPKPQPGNGGGTKPPPPKPPPRP